MSKQLNSDYVGVSVSWATMKNEDIVPTYVEFLQSVAKDCKIETEVEAIVEELNSLKIETEDGNIIEYGQAGFDDLRGFWYFEQSDKLDWLAYETLYDLLNDIAPEGCYFGSHPGNGSDFGFWLAEDDF
jgi:hypothetical protein